MEVLEVGRDFGNEVTLLCFAGYVLWICIKYLFQNLYWIIYCKIYP
jgi:hypothetical protein